MVSGVSEGVSPLYRETLVTSVAGVFLLLSGSTSAYRQVYGSYVPAIPRVFADMYFPKVQNLHQ